MSEEQNCPEMAEPMKLVKISVKNFDWLKKYGFASESLNTALDRVREIVEKKDKKQ